MPSDADGLDCPDCGEMFNGLDRHAITAYRLEGNRCGSSGHRIAGRYDAQSDWERQQMPVRS